MSVRTVAPTDAVLSPTRDARWRSTSTCNSGLPAANCDPSQLVRHIGNRFHHSKRNWIEFFQPPVVFTFNWMERPVTPVPPPLIESQRRKPSQADRQTPPDFRFGFGEQTARAHLDGEGCPFRCARTADTGKNILYIRDVFQALLHLARERVVCVSGVRARVADPSRIYRCQWSQERHFDELRESKNREEHDQTDQRADLFVSQRPTRNCR